MSTAYINVRVTAEERDAIYDAARDYGFRNAAEFVRVTMLHVAHNRPALQLQPRQSEEKQEPEEQFAPTLETIALG